ncbi:hypothetical protein CYB_1528 [Synechococcus sp. JA-2-3B'a(2-13)]|nr:hypothetical protein CYB_1528 [Synechococcus sp. JA-2-3B'a(2-13)]
MIEITVADLSDCQRMCRHFYRIGRTLLDLDAAKTVRDQPTWFEAPS